MLCTSLSVHNVKKQNTTKIPMPLKQQYNNHMTDMTVFANFLSFSHTHTQMLIDIIYSNSYSTVVQRISFCVYVCLLLSHQLYSFIKSSMYMNRIFLLNVCFVWHYAIDLLYYNILTTTTCDYKQICKIITHVGHVLH